ncbi:ABC transporter ATP-binding protein [Dictyobacter kobayashii]|uniref:ABC transporter domain-containing protein n=1 Tax=Dictyobacter kobayashii TaxID=2014872 RepID=A0A402AJ35_9CHLR|nr:ABC transporter ATP-binding protein [Dictyobacter kobayashii]GCE19109.1 hypothetical protein KDK_29090 [Dictyobacter kobayashii]
MDDVSQSFSYTARRTTYLTIVCSLGFLFLAESGGVALLVTLLSHNLWLSLAINLSHLALCLFIMKMMLAVLFTRHQLTKTALQLRYGSSLNVQIPYSAILDIQPVRDMQATAQPVSARYDAGKQRITACFSDQGQLLLRCIHPLPLKLGRKEYQVSNLLFNVDQRDTFLAQIALLRATGTAEEPAELEFAPVQKSSPAPTAPGLAGKTQKSALPLQKSAIRLQGLTRTFADFVAVDHVQMTIQEGEIYGFLGSNGAGKTTTIKMLVGLLEPSSGQVWMGEYNVWQDPVAARALIGYVADRALLYERLTGREFLQFLAQIRGLSEELAERRITHLLEMLALSDQAGQLCGSYSFGMKRKLALAAALLHEPRILILDEPLNGLDPRSARYIKDLLLQLAAGGTTILLSTHDLATAEAVCDRVGIFHRGRLLAEGSTSELRQLAGAGAADLETVFLQLIQEQKAEVTA